MRLDGGQCRERFAAGRHAVLAANDAAGAPLAVPITFALVRDGDGADVVVFAVDHKPKSGAPLRRMQLIAADPRVAVLVEHYDADWQHLWWVRADGRAEVLPTGRPECDPADAERRAGLTALADRYPQYVEHPPAGDLVRIRVDRWTGWAYA